MGIVLSWLTVSLGLWVADKVLKDFRIEGGASSYLLLGALVGVLHFLLGWLLFGVLAIATLGIGYLLGFLTRLVVTALILKLADAMSRRFTIEGFVPALLAAALMSVVSVGVDWIVH
jgi:putative membrane protein